MYVTLTLTNYCVIVTKRDVIISEYLTPRQPIDRYAAWRQKWT